MSLTILVVEDNEQNLYLMRFLLERHGFNVVAVMNGRDAVNVAEKTRPHLVLLDIQLPGIDGYTVAAALRRSAIVAQVPIVAVTSYAMVGDKEKALGAGATDYIEKPIDPETFVARISKHLPPELLGTGR